MSDGYPVAAERRYGRLTQSVVDGLRARAGETYDRWDELRRSRPNGIECPGAEALALREYWLASAEVRGAERLALALGFDVDHVPAPPLARPLSPDPGPATRG